MEDVALVPELRRVIRFQHQYPYLIVRVLIPNADEANRHTVKRLVSFDGRIMITGQIFDFCDDSDTCCLSCVRMGARGQNGRYSDYGE